MNPARASPMEPLFRAATRGHTLQFGMPVPARCEDAEVEEHRLARLGIADVSGLPRATVKGPSSADLLSARGLPVPDAWFEPQAMRFAIDRWSFVARTGQAEFWVEGSSPLESEDLAIEALLYPRQDASLLLSGEKVPELLAEVLPLPDDADSGKLCLTQIARVNGALLSRSPRSPRSPPSSRSAGPADGPLVQLWFDPTYALYLGGVLKEIAEELGGGLVGVDVFKRAGLLPPEA